MKHSRSQRTGVLWWLQGVCSALMLLVAIYLGQALMPRLNALQPQVIAQNVQPTAQVQAEFDAAHKSYTRWTKVVVYLGLGALLALSLRTAGSTPVQDETDAI